MALPPRARTPYQETSVTPQPTSHAATIAHHIRQHQPSTTTDAKWGNFKPSRRGQCKPSLRVMLSEHVPAEMFADEHYADQLVERMGRALVDPEHPGAGDSRLTERGPGRATPQGSLRLPQGGRASSPVAPCRHVQAHGACPDRWRGRQPSASIYRRCARRCERTGTASDARGEGVRLGERDRADDHRRPPAGPAGGSTHRRRRRGRPPAQNDRREGRRREQVSLLPRGMVPDRSVRHIYVLVPRIAGRRGLVVLR